MMMVFLFLFPINNLTLKFNIILMLIELTAEHLSSLNELKLFQFYPLTLSFISL